jgi:hypothetical protein
MALATMLSRVGAGDVGSLDLMGLEGVTGIPNVFFKGEEEVMLAGATLHLFSSFELDGSSSMSHKNDSKSERLMVFLRDDCFIIVELKENVGTKYEYDNNQMVQITL